MYLQYHNLKVRNLISIKIHILILISLINKFMGRRKINIESIEHNK